MDKFSIKQVSASIDNLIRLGLIVVPTMKTYSDKTIYNRIKNNPKFIELKQKTISTLKSGEEIEHEYTSIDITDLSNIFYKICVLNP